MGKGHTQSVLSVSLEPGVRVVSRSAMGLVTDSQRSPASYVAMGKGYGVGCMW